MSLPKRREDESEEDFAVRLETAKAKRRERRREYDRKPERKAKQREYSRKYRKRGRNSEALAWHRGFERVRRRFPLVQLRSLPAETVKELVSQGGGGVLSPEKGGASLQAAHKEALAKARRVANAEKRRVLLEKQAAEQDTPGDEEPNF